jgi:L-threonylcarbamoyladenylate synthase
MVDFNRDIEECVKVLQAGGIIIYPTDTVWGIGCDATSSEAVNRIYAIKKRTLEKAMIVLVADERDILQYVASPDLRVFDYLAEIKKPTTVIYEGAIGLADNLTGSDGTVAIRICHDIFCRNLIKRFRKPLVSTSANLSGNSSPSSFHDISKEILDKADYVVKYRQEDETTSEPSALIRWHQDGSHTVIRS